MLYPFPCMNDDDLLLRFSEAVDCIGTTPAAVRQWLQHGKISIEHGYGSGWATFTLHDIANLTLTRVLATDFNIEVAEAFQIARDAIEKWRAPRFKTEGEEFWRGWQDHELVLRRDANSRRWSVSRFRFRSVVAGMPFKQVIVRKSPNTLQRTRETLEGNFLHIDVAMIVKSAIERALEHIAARQTEPQRQRA